MPVLIGHGAWLGGVETLHVHLLTYSRTSPTVHTYTVRGLHEYKNCLRTHLHLSPHPRSSVLSRSHTPFQVLRSTTHRTDALKSCRIQRKMVRHGTTHARAQEMRRVAHVGLRRRSYTFPLSHALLPSPARTPCLVPMNSETALVRTCIFFHTKRTLCAHAHRARCLRPFSIVRMYTVHVHTLNSNRI